jgi:ABC-type polysaccharide/polyol phosphate transport system ATPase subunit
MPPADPAIRLQGLSKKYRLFDNPRQRLKEALDPFGRAYHRDFWALKDIDLAVPKGYTVGIIGRNGSGKSTLLQIISSVLQPTSGAVEVLGRVAALLELGAGFDPDFTGRQNVRQFGWLRGMRRDEIEARLPEIEKFANIGDFFDRPVKVYSSGMFARVAFAAAINVDPDILILDEILAVGDIRFQQRSFERIRQLQESGTTVLLVSHALEAVVEHCDTAILLEQGRLLADGDPKEVTDRYRDLLFAEIAEQIGGLKGTARPQAAIVEGGAGQEYPAIAREMLAQAVDRDLFRVRPGFNPEETVSGSGGGEILDYRIMVDDVEVATNSFLSGQKIRFHVLTLAMEWPDEAEFGFALRRVDGLYIYGTNSTMRRSAFDCWKKGDRLVFSFGISLTIQSGHYFLDFGLFRKVNDETIILLTRRNSVHLVVHRTPHFDGIVDLEPLKTTGTAE